ncbi:hypothetical protein SBRCBS47491_008441 [Sporothrix bragantina]|uniref:Zn(2)-C6 fungal-type domain-containing protein n=1 Tax=Sporothrix bragantina TaxID=671064 RepID=A0ABP0CLH0_9PEZI
MPPRRIRTVEGSCWRCKDRRIKCDLSYPVCERCTDAGQVCEYGRLRLRWAQPATTMGVTAGSAVGPTTPPGILRRKSTSSTHSTHSPHSNGCRSPRSPSRWSVSSVGATTTTGTTTTTAVSVSVSVSLAMETAAALAGPPRQPSIILDSEYYMLYFENDFIPRFHLLDKSLYIDLVSLLQNPLLLHSATAVASAHHTLSKGGGSLSADAILSMTRFRTEAIKELRESLLLHTSTTAPVPWNIDLDASNDPRSPSRLFTANALLCILDGMIEPSPDSAAAREHLRGGRAILDAWDGKTELFSAKSGVSMLMLSIFSSMDLTHAFLSGDMPYFDEDEWPKFAGAVCWWGVLDDSDPFLQINAVSSRLACLGHHVRTRPDSLVSVSELLAIQLSLERTRTSSLVGTQNSWDGSNNSSPAAEAWAIFCSAYRHVALIYLYRVLCKEPVDHWMIQQIVAEGVEAIAHPALTGKLGHCVLFPALVLGCHCVDLDQRRKIRQVVLSSASYLAFGCIKTIDAFLQTTWQTDMQFTWWECFEPISQTGFFF